MVYYNDIVCIFTQLTNQNALFMKRYLLIGVLLFVQAFVQAQEIKGKVTDSNGIPIPDVIVLVLETKENTVTDFDGNFSIKANSGDEIQFSMLSFEKTVVKASSNMVVVLKDDNQSQLNEVVMIGYGTKKLGSITGSVAQIKSADILRTPAQSAIQSIQGKLAGVNIITNDEPGANPTIQVRGLGTLLGGRDPLYVIDGIESTGLNGLSPSEIASMDILKDASSLAIYGQKGSNGVVIVTTKKGKEGGFKINYDSYYGVKSIQREVKMADSYRFTYYNNVALGSSTYFNLNNQPYNTNWLDEITDTGSVMSNFISLSGGSEKANYYLGYTNYQEEGILNGTKFDRNNINSRLEVKLLDDRLKISNAINFAIVKNTPKPLSAFTNAYKQSPIMPVKYPNGRWGMPFVNEDGFNDMDGVRYNNVGNPVAQLFYTNEQNKNFTVFGSVKAELEIIDDLKFATNFGTTYDMGQGYTFTPNRDIWLSQNPTLEIEDYQESNPINTLNQRKYDNFSWNWDNYFTYTKTFGENEITGVLGMSRSTKNVSSYLSGTRLNVPEQSNYWTLDFSTNNTTIAPGAVVSNSQSTPIVSIAYFARADYEYGGKYLVTASIRREGISSFQEDQRWGMFPAVSVGWVMSNEDFFTKIELVNYLKIRGGYGEVANGNTGNSLNNLVFASGYNYAFGADQQIFAGANIPFQVDPSLSWETMKEIDFGFDFRMLENKLSGTFDIYNRNSENVILPVSLPPVLSPGSVYLNTGTVSNNGVELSLRWEDSINDNWRYSIGANYSHNKNELKNVNNAYFANVIGGSLGNGQWTKQVLVGEPLGSFYVYDVTGYNSDGGFTYSEERVNAGSYLPTYNYGVNLAIFYKNFDFSTDLFGVGGNKIYNGKKAQRFGGENVEYALLDDFWLPSNPNAENPKPFNEVPVASTYYVEDGAFLRINNITLGYVFPKFYEKIDKVRLYATAVNPFIFTKYTGYSPEIAGGNNGDPLGGAGIELDAYPTNRTFTLGLNVAF
jgi:TonB-dependent starch-binding outer membrane protein SusC